MAPRFRRWVGLALFVAAAGAVVWWSLPRGDPLPPPPEPARPEPTAAPFDFTAAEASVESLTRLLESGKAGNDAILAALDVTAGLYRESRRVGRPAEPDATSPAGRFQRDAEGAFLRALKVEKAGKDPRVNERDPVNVRAVVALREAHPRVTKSVIDRIEDRIVRARVYEPSPSFVDEAFRTVAVLGDRRTGLPFLEGWIRYDNFRGQPERIRAALSALAEFPALSGHERFRIVDRLLTAYVGVEHASEVDETQEDRAQHEVWAVIGPAAVRLASRLADEPTGTDGKPLGTMKGIWSWFRNDGHDDLKRPPWTDEPR